jgi:hypothetical protein
MISRKQIRSLVSRELDIIDDPARRAGLEALLIEPRSEERDWDYGAPGDKYPYWVVAESTSRKTMLVHCEGGFGPEMPWGFLFSGDQDHSTLGMDSQWCWYLEEAYVRSGLWTGFVKPAYGESFHQSPATRFSSSSKSAT